MIEIETPIRLPNDLARRAVVADADAGGRAELARLLRARGFEVIEASDGLEALDRIGALAPLVALMGRDLPSCDGERAAALASLLYPRTRVILTTADDADFGDGAFPVLARPIDHALLDRWLGGLAA